MAYYLALYGALIAAWFRHFPFGDLAAIIQTCHALSQYRGSRKGAKQLQVPRSSQGKDQGNCSCNMMLFVYREVVFIWLLFLELLFILDLSSVASPFISRPISLFKIKSWSLKIRAAEYRGLSNIPRHCAYYANHRDHIWDVVAESYLYSIVILIYGNAF